MTVVLVTKRHYKPQQTPLDKKKKETPSLRVKPIFTVHQ